jgi:hypothetical protein
LAGDAERNRGWRRALLGLPVELFAGWAPRWLGVLFNRTGEVEQPRVLLLASVPYALKASDADTLGGIPASRYLLADTATNPAGSAEPSATVTTAFKNPFKPLISSGAVNIVGKFVNANDLGNRPSTSPTALSASERQPH